VKQFLTILAAFVLLFVVVCPITPTPLAVPGGKSQTVQVSVTAVAFVAVVLLVRPEHPLWIANSFEASNAVPVDVVNLTCARLC
jgi:hypothetical protein